MLPGNRANRLSVARWTQQPAVHGMAKQRAAAVQQYLLQLQGDVTSAQRQQIFAGYLKRVGDGTEKTAVVRALLTSRQLRQLTATYQQTGCLNPCFCFVRVAQVSQLLWDKLLWPCPICCSSWPSAECQRCCTTTVSCCYFCIRQQLM